MRGTRAKEIRRKVYGDFALRGERPQTTTLWGVVVNLGLRASYLESKRRFRQTWRKK